MNDNVHRLLTDFGKYLGLESLALDENGHCSLTFDETCVHIEAMDESSFVLLHSSLGEIPENSGREIYTRLLDANYFFQHTAGATLGLEADTGLVVMSHVVDMQDMELSSWEAVVQAFVDAAESCARLCNTQAGSAPSVSRPASSDHMSFA